MFTRAFVFLILLLSLTLSAGAQSLEQRIDAVRRQRLANPAQNHEAALRKRQRTVAQRMHRIIDAVQLDATPARDAFTWWSRTADIPLILNWDAMAVQGVDPQARITVKLRQVPAEQLLRILLRAMQPPSLPVEFVYNVRSGYVEVLTKAQANRRPVLRVYDVGDLVMEIPDFTDAPSFDLREALSNTNSGGGGGGGGGNAQQLFKQQNQNAVKPPLTRAQRGQQLAQLIRDTIEPTIWQANGGTSASVRFFRDRLIIKAPEYVQRQIGMPVRGHPLPMLGGRVAPLPTYPTYPAKPPAAGNSAVSSDHGEQPD